MTMCYSNHDANCDFFSILLNESNFLILHLKESHLAKIDQSKIYINTPWSFLTSIVLLYFIVILSTIAHYKIKFKVFDDSTLVLLVIASNEKQKQNVILPKPQKDIPLRVFLNQIAISRTNLQSQYQNFPNRDLKLLSGDRNLLSSDQYS